MAGVTGDCFGTFVVHGTLESPAYSNYKDNHDLFKLYDQLQLGDSTLPSMETCMDIVAQDQVTPMDIDDYGVAVDNMQVDLRINSHNEIADHSKEINYSDLFSKKKLHLVLDLDHTLIHTRKFKELTYQEIHLKKKTVDSLQDKRSGSLFSMQLEDRYLVKLRPYVRTFLEESSAMFEMYVCTMATRDYAEEIVKLLDPEGKYFNKSRLISREDFNSVERKSLDLVLGHECGIIILDDNESVWSGHIMKNLILMKPYDYFKNKYCMTRSYSETCTDESEVNGVLANVLKVLKTIHGLFFENQNDLACKDVRTLLGQVRSEVLKGCTLFFSDVENFSLAMSRAVEMGAKVTVTHDSSVTHVVSLKTYGSKDCEWARREKKFLVHPMWIDTAYYLWRRQPEEEYFPFSILRRSLRTAF